MQRDVKAMLDGAVGGVVGTAGMSAFMLAAGKMGLMGEQPPDKIAGAALDAAGIHAREEEAQDALATLLHFGFGIGCGALFGVLHRRLPLRVPAAPHGMFFAFLIWATSYQGWIPALGIMPPAHRDHPRRPLAMILAHFIYGALLGTVVARRSPPPDPLPCREGEPTASAHR
jgi:ribose/xylose/arabinose/galactoside ABC-type transport system permease subunit